ncbi:MacS family sensor histidine kinase [Nocardioides sp.]|uniref:MacS family sensor histidine kinase n=1 Tax=Nocardioides sp. TaxID=35761 RepID=UPI0035140127
MVVRSRATASPVGAAELAVEGRMFVALAVLRVVVLAYAVGLNLYRGVDRFDHPAAGYAVLAAMVGWSVLMIVLTTVMRRRDAGLVLADLAVALGVLALTPVVKGPWFEASIPGFWVMAALLTCAVRFGTLGGLGAGLLIGGLDLAQRQEIAGTTIGNDFLLLIGGPIVGLLCRSLQQMAHERDQAERAAAAAEERARLARVVHDGVLQVLALVQRRGGELGGEAAELGRLAGEQEVRLRSLIRSQDAVLDTAPVELLGQLGRLALRPGVEVVVPAGTVDLPGPVVAELVAVVGACLDNVTRHVGEGAPAWVLAEVLPDVVVLTVRDEGPGIPPGRLEEAAAQGRLGVAESIRGRIRDLGGTAELTTGGFGTEWEFTVPRTSPGAAG